MVVYKNMRLERDQLFDEKSSRSVWLIYFCLFGDCLGLCWYNDVIVLVNGTKCNHKQQPQHQINIGTSSSNLGITSSNHTTATLLQSNREYILMFYPKNHLSNSSLLHKTVIPQGRKPLFIDCNDTYLIILTHDSFFYQ